MCLFVGLSVCLWSSSKHNNAGFCNKADNSGMPIIYILSFFFKFTEVGIQSKNVLVPGLEQIRI